MPGQLGLLGDIEFTLDGGEPAPLVRANQRRMIAVFGVHYRQPIASEWLAELLELKPGGLRTRIRRIRQIVGQQTIVTQGSGYRLGAVTIDAERFEEQRAEAVGLPTEARVEVLRECLDQWRGDALSEFAHETWAAGEAARLNELRSSTADQLAEGLIELGRYAESTAGLEAQIARAPFRDKSRRLMMLALARAGRTAEAIRVFQVYREFLIDETGTEPADETRALEQAILEGDFTGAPKELAGGSVGFIDSVASSAAPPQPTTASNIAAVRPTLIGRADELALLTEMLDGNRLVTVIGPGGAGKSALAIEVAAGLLEQYPDGVHVVELAGLTDATLLANSLAAAVGLRAEPGGYTAAALAAALRDQRQLLVIDNAEPILDAVADLVDEILTVEGPTMLVTSREWLDIPGERTFHLPPMTGVGPNGRSYGAELFVTNAASAGVATEQFEDEVVEALCARLDHLPLALELAAGSAIHLTPAQILGSLERGERLAATRRRNRARRFTSVDEMLEGSFALLDASERSLLLAMGAFRGPSTLDAIAGVWTASPSMKVADVLGSLVMRSFVASDQSDDGVTYRLLETVRDFAIDRAEDQGSLDEVRRMHRDWFLAWSDTPTLLHQFASTAHARRFERQLANFRVAMTYSLNAGEPELAQRQAANLAGLWFTFMHGDEGLRWYEASAPPADRSSERLVYLMGALSASFASERWESAMQLSQELGQTVATLDTPETVLGAALFGVTHVLDHDEGLRWLDEARQRDERWSTGLLPLVDHLAGDVLLYAARHEESVDRYQAAVDVIDPDEFGWLASACHAGIGLNLFALGQAHLGQRSIDASLATARSMPDSLGGITRGEVLRTVLMSACGDSPQARRLLLAEIDRTESHRRTPVFRGEPLVGVVHLALDAERYDLAAGLHRLLMEAGMPFRSPWQSALCRIAAEALDRAGTEPPPLWSLDEALDRSRKFLLSAP